MGFIEIIIVAIAGLLAGGIVNALADDFPYRRNPGLPVYPDGSPRPILSWLGLTAFIIGLREPQNPEANEKRARHYEGTPKLTWRYPITEVVTVLLFIATYGLMIDEPDTSLLQMVFWLFYMALFMLINVVDLEHKLIMFVYMIPSAVIAIIDAAILSGAPTLQSALTGGLLGFVIFFIFYQGGYLFTYIMGRARGEEINTVAFGFGDVMMITLSGLIVGFENIIFVMFISIFLGSVGAIVYLTIRFFSRDRYQLFTAIPYGPYIVASTIIVFLFSAEVRLALLGY